MSTDVKAPEREWFKKRAQQEKEPEWLADVRLQAWDLVEQLPLPKVEKMRIQRWEFMDFMTAGGQEAVHTKAFALPKEVKETLQWTEDQKHRPLVVQENGDTIFAQLPDDLKQQGIIFQSLEEAFKENEDLVRMYLMGDAMKMDEHRMTALHAALLHGGIFVYVPKNLEVEVPLEYCFWATGRKAGFFPHLLLVAGENSRLTFIEQAVSAGGQTSGTFVGGTEVFVERGACVRFASVRLLNQITTDFSFRRAVVKGDGCMTWILAELNEGNTYSENVSILKEPGATADAKLMTIGKGKQQANYVSRIVHNGHHTQSRIFSRGVATDASWVMLNSFTRISKGASKADGQQSGSVLVLSEQSRGDANPVLFIDEDDVQAGHAASIGQVNPEQVYYLMSRGLSRKEAERLITLGFLMPVISQIPSESLRSRIQAVVERKVLS